MSKKLLAVRLGTDLSIGRRKLGKPLYQTAGKEVGGSIEIVHPKGLPEPYCVIVNDEGLLLKLPVNVLGSLLYGTQEHGHPIVGHALLMKTGMTPEGPDVVGLTEDEAALMEHWLLREYAILHREEEGKTHEDQD